MHAVPKSNADAELQLALSRTPEAAQLQKRLFRTASIRFGDIVERIEAGAGLPSEQLCVTFRVEDVAHFASVHGIEGAHSGCNRLTAVFLGPQTTFDVEQAAHVDCMERASPRRRRRARVHLQTFRTRRRHFRDTAAGYCHAQRLADAAIADLGPAWACAIFLQAEREYWMSGCSGEVHDSISTNPDP